ncbi:MAG TPA: DUF4832 domain-containing protein [Cyclobacteriaceae bacterium]
MTHIDRRSFIKTSGMGLTGFSLLGLSSPAGGMGFSNKRGATVLTNHSVRPADNGKALVNPSMGWTFHFYSNQLQHYGSRLEPSDTLDDFPGLTTIYLRCPWAFVEPEEGKFDWELLDTPGQRWIDKGLKVAFRITGYESWMRYATPEWVKNAGAKGSNVRWGRQDRELWRPDFADPVYLAKLEKFLSIMADRYDGNPNVAFVDIGSMGVWGEGHSAGESQYATLEEGQKMHIDLHCKYFKSTLICMSDDFVGTTDNSKTRFPISDYAFSKGVTLRDDSIMVQPPPDSWYSAGMAQLFWPTLPVVLENEHYGSSKRRNAHSPELLLKSIEDYHASYTCIHWWPRIFMEENIDAINKVNLRLGYRIQIREISWPEEVRLGQPFTVSLSLANAGVAPCYPGGYPCITLKDEKGGIVSVLVDTSFNVRELEVAKPGEAPIKTISSTFAISRNLVDPVNVFYRAAAPGTYDLFVSIGTSDGTPQLELPHDNDDGHKRYKVGTIKVGDRQV